MSGAFTRAQVTEKLKAIADDHSRGIEDSPDAYELAEWGCPWSFNRAPCDNWKKCFRGVEENQKCWNDLAQRRAKRQ